MEVIATRVTRRRLQQEQEELKLALELSQTPKQPKRESKSNKKTTPRNTSAKKNLASSGKKSKKKTPKPPVNTKPVQPVISTSGRSLRSRK